MLKNALFLSLFVGFALCKPLHKRWDDFQVKHAWVEGVPNGWEVVGPAPSWERLTVRIGLKQDGIDDLVSHLYAVSDPDHPRYGQHLTKEQVDALSAPHPDSTALIEDWLLHHGLLHDPGCQMSRSSSGDWISLSISIVQLEQMLGTKYHVYKHTTTETTLIRTTSYSLPRILHNHVTVVTPSTYFNLPKPQAKTSFVTDITEYRLAAIDEGLRIITSGGVQSSPPPVSPTCDSRITPSCLIGLYNMSYTPVSTSNNSLGVAGYLDEFANHADLKLFTTAFRQEAINGDFSVVQIADGGNDQNKPGSEANLDIQYTVGLVYPTPTTYYSVGGSPPFVPDSNTPKNTNEPYLSFLDYIFNQTSIPQTITTSYGDDEQTVPPDYAQTVCNEFMKLGAMGTSVLFSSGDSGVGGGSCTTNDGTNAVKFIPVFPASCPYVTAVGGTNGTNPEQAVYFSGGGFSNYFGRPDYQSQTVGNFLTAFGSQTYAGLFNSSGRAYPDVSAQGLNYQVVVGGKLYAIGGTSASAPTFASVISLVNDARIAAKLPPLGFLNPWLYSQGYRGLNDIVGGNNPGCNTQGFEAVKGWDPVTGLGTPNFGLLKDIALGSTGARGARKRGADDVRGVQSN